MKHPTDNTKRKAHYLEAVGFAESTDNEADYAMHGITSPEKIAFLHSCRFAIAGNTGKHQRERLLIALQRYSVTTYEAREYLDIYYPPARVIELRALGYNITTYRQTVFTDNGGKHNVGLYVLESMGNQHQPINTLEPIEPIEPITEMAVC